MYGSASEVKWNMGATDAGTVWALQPQAIRE
jgi:hypothetical protein